ncbi:hypothetical protein [Trujillonella humicola]|uniref:hypothetical protein n=1 Tax=Trujillonella humicola TaxID=3383699 RepID=UPI0039063EEE
MAVAVGSPPARRTAPPGWRRCALLPALALGVVVLAAAGVVPTWPGLVHLVGLPPLDLFADLRVLLVATGSWPAFVVLLVLVFAARVAVLAFLMGGLDRARLRFAALFYAVVLPLLGLVAFLDAAAYTVLYSRVFWVALTVVAIVVLTDGPVPWQGTARLRRAIAGGWREALRLEVTLPYAAVVLALGALADRLPALTLPLVPVSALATVLAIRALSRPVPAWVRPRSALARLGAFAVVLAVAGTAFVSTRGVAMPADADPRPGSLLIMSGINSSSGSGAIFEVEVERLGFDCDQTYYFSYAGTGDGQPQNSATCPIRTGAPYQPEDTQRPVEEQVELLAEQVSDLPRPVVVAAHSHAVWVAWEAAGRGAPIDVLVFVGAFADSPLGYPPQGEDGTGRVLGDLIRAFVPVTDWVDFHFRPDAPASRELLATPGAASRIMDRPLPPGVRSLSITSATDLPLMPGGWRLAVDRNACPARASHPLLPQQPVFYQEVNRFLDERPALRCPPWRDWGAALSIPFGPPT